MKRIPNIKQIIQIVEEIAPKTFSLPGDPVGLQCGEPDQAVKRLMVSLDASMETVIQATQFKADLLVTHHPLWFDPLTQDNILGPAGRTLTRAVQEGVAVYSAHTNLDASPQGINASLADLLDLRERHVLKKTGSGFFKLVVFVPPDSLEKVRLTALNAGAGKVGNYSGCSFSIEGTGAFHPEEGASPAIGRIGNNEKVQEARLELSVTAQALDHVLYEVRRVHPYEEPAVDVYSLIPGNRDTGLGISGVLPKRSTVREVAERLGSLLKAGPFRLVGKKGGPIRKVAVCSGSGASLLDAVVAAQAELYITGDIKYHDARHAEDAGIRVLDVGHFAPEKYGLLRFGKLLEKKLTGQGLKIEIAYAKERDPFTVLS